MNLTNNKWFLILVGVLVVILLALAFYHRPYTAGAWVNECYQYQECQVTPSISPTVTSEVTETPSATPSVEPTGIPQGTPNVGLSDNQSDHQSDHKSTSVPKSEVLPPCTMSNCGWK